MTEVLITTIGGILLNLFSSSIFDKGKSLLESHSKAQFQESIQSWLKKFFSVNKELIFESSALCSYMEYQKPIQKIAEYLQDVDSPAVSEEIFIKKLVSHCRDYLVQAGHKCSISEECAIHDLFHGVLQLCRNRLKEKTTDGEMLILLQQRQNDAKMEGFCQDTKHELEAMSTQLQSLLAQHEKITDSETIEKVYNLLSDAIWDGRLAEVRGFFPLLAGKNDDLENAIKIKLSVLSDDCLSVVDPLELCSKINSAKLRDDVFRLLIMNYYKEPGKLMPYVEFIVDLTLREIAGSLAEGRMEQIVGFTKGEKDNVILNTCSIAKGLESEMWLVRRLYILAIEEHPMYHSAEVVRKLAEQPNFIDQLYIWELTIRELVCLSSGNGEEATAYGKIAAEMRSRIYCYTHARLDLKQWFYKRLVQVMDAAKDGCLSEVLDSIPASVSALPEIEATRLLETVKNGTADQDTIMKFVLRTEQYWLLVYYCDSLHDCQRSLEVIRRAEYLIGQSPDIFECALSSIYQVNGKSMALTFLKGYEKQYANLSIFWIKAYWLSETDEDRQWVADAIVARVQEKSLQSRRFSEQKYLADILLAEERYDEALGLLLTIETMGFGDADVARMKVHVYTHTDRQIDALVEIEKHYNELKHDEQMVDMLLTASLNFRRPITDEMLTDAKKLKNSRILMLAAKAEHSRKNFSEAEKLAMQSMLIAQPEDEELFVHAFQIILDGASQQGNAPGRVGANTYFTAENQQTHVRLTFCVYQDDILPYTGYLWKESQHISIDSAVEQGFMRLVPGDTVEIQGASYTVVEIGPLSGFYFRVCLASMEQQNLMWQISAEKPEELTQNIVALFQEHPEWNRQDWIKNYSDFSHTACPVYLFKSGSNLECGQLMRLIVEDPSVPVREYVFPAREGGEREYVITYTALVVLHQLGVEPQGIRDRCVVPGSAVREARHEADKLLADSSRDIVASMSVQDEQVQISQPTERMIQERTQAAIKFKQYAAGFTSVENTQDADIPGLQNAKLIEFIGICDYDALILAHARGAVLVTCEMITAELTKLEEINSEPVGIADFLCLIGLELPALLDLLKQMLQYHFCSVITPMVIQHIISTYDTTEDEGKQEIEKAWKAVLAVPGDLSDDYYLKVFIRTCFTTIQILKEKGLFSHHPIIYAFCRAVFYYNGGRVKWEFRDGDLYFQIYHTNSFALDDSQQRDGGL